MNERRLVYGLSMVILVDADSFGGFMGRISRMELQSTPRPGSWLRVDLYPESAFPVPCSFILSPLPGDHEAQQPATAA